MPKVTARISHGNIHTRTDGDAMRSPLAPSLYMYVAHILFDKDDLIKKKNEKHKANILK